MASYYVGQRVRIKFVFKPSNRGLVGREGRISEIREIFGMTHIGLDVSPLFDSAGVGFAPEQLEPILYDGHQPVEWSDCLWSPHRQGVAA